MYLGWPKTRKGRRSKFGCQYVDILLSWAMKLDRLSNNYMKTWARVLQKIYGFDESAIKDKVSVYKVSSNIFSQMSVKVESDEETCYQQLNYDFAHALLYLNLTGSSSYNITEMPITLSYKSINPEPLRLEVDANSFIAFNGTPEVIYKVTFEEIFPEVKQVDIETAKSLVRLLDIKERVIQDALRDALREKSATNIIERKSDSSLEVADLEDFALKIKKRSVSFSSVVKGYRSIGARKKITFEDIAHQIMKANDTLPDHILLVLAKPITDGVITNLVKYGIQCGNRDLVVIVDQVNLARFLRARSII